MICNYQEDIKRILLGKELDKPLFTKYTKKIDNHAFRREYSKTRYKEILGEREDKNDYKGYDKNALKILTKDLGHNRLDVVVYNYLR